MDACPGRGFFVALAKTLPPFSYFDVIDACARPGCPFCRLSEETVNRYLGAILYENVNDPGTRDQLRSSLGYCNEHAWRLTATRGRALVRPRAGAPGEARDQPPTSGHGRAGEALDRGKPASATETAVRGLAPQ